MCLFTVTPFLKTVAKAEMESVVYMGFGVECVAYFFICPTSIHNSFSSHTMNKLYRLLEFHLHFQITKTMDEEIANTTTESAMVELQQGDVMETTTHKNMTIAHYIAYVGLMPVLFTIGIASSVACIIVLRRPTFKSLHARW